MPQSPADQSGNNPLPRPRTSEPTSGSWTRCASSTTRIPAVWRPQWAAFFGGSNGSSNGTDRSPRPRTATSSPQVSEGPRQGARPRGPRRQAGAGARCQAAAPGAGRRSRSPAPPRRRTPAPPAGPRQAAPRRRGGRARQGHHPPVAKDADAGRARRGERRADVHRAARHPRGHRQEHGPLADRADGDVGAHPPGQAAVGQPHRHQQPPRPRPRRQGLLHPPHRLRAGQGAAGRCRR